MPLALAALDLSHRAALLDFDDPETLGRERLRPSAVATRRREITQPQARRLFEAHSVAAGLRWWSVYESTWINVTLFDCAAAALRVRQVRTLTIGDPAVLEERNRARMARRDDRKYWASSTRTGTRAAAITAAASSWTSSDRWLCIARLDCAARPDGAGVFEYACHEGNHGMRYRLAASRLADGKSPAESQGRADQK